MRSFTDPDITTADSRIMDRLLWRLRSHIRSARLPRPNRVVITDAGSSVYVDYGVGQGTTRVRHLLSWCRAMPGLRVRCVLRRNGYLAVWAVGRLVTAPLLVSAGADLRDLGGQIEHTHGAAYGRLGELTFTVDEVTTLDWPVLLAALCTPTETRNGAVAA
jgi:hypothetical protein